MLFILDVLSQQIVINIKKPESRNSKTLTTKQETLNQKL